MTRLAKTRGRTRSKNGDYYPCVAHKVYGPASVEAWWYDERCPHVIVRIDGQSVELKLLRRRKPATKDTP